MATDASGLVQMAQASQRMTALSYNAYQILVYDADDKRIDVISKEYQEHVGRLRKRLQLARQFAPDEGQTIDGFDRAATEIIRLTDTAGGSTLPSKAAIDRHSRE